MEQKSADEIELAVISTSGSAAGDWKDSARPLMMQLIEQGLTVLMRDELWAEMMQKVECSFAILQFCHFALSSLSVIQFAMSSIQREQADDDEAEMDGICEENAAEEPIQREQPKFVEIRSQSSAGSIETNQ